jgi:hypothetical protein
MVGGIGGLAVVIAGLAVVILAVWVMVSPVAARMGMPDGPPTAGQGGPITTAQAREKAAQFLTDNGFSTLTITEVTEFSNDFYAVAADPSTGTGAFELIVSRDGSLVHPGPTMMWNTGYDLMGLAHGSMMGAGMMGQSMMGGNASHEDHHQGGQGMMGSGTDMMAHGQMTSQNRMMDPAACANMMGATASAPLDTPLTLDQARESAQRWLDQQGDALTAGAATSFPGYATFNTQHDGQVVGMLSVSTATGALWSHVWLQNAVTGSPVN